MALILNQRKRTLTSDSYGFVKTIRCPLNKKWDELQVVDKVGRYEDEFTSVLQERHRHCYSCQRNVFNLDGLSEEQIEASIMANPTICIHATLPHPAILEDPASKRLVSDWISANPNCPRVDKEYKGHGLREVKTARSLEALNQAVEDGLMILVAGLEPDAQITQPVFMIKNADGTFAEMLSYRDIGLMLTRSNEDERLESYRSFEQYHYQFKKPWAAYLIPSDIKIGEQVFVWDVIQDRKSTRMNQGGGYTRQTQAIATWTGDDLDIPVVEQEEWVG
jgi:hypothetical protein